MMETLNDTTCLTDKQREEQVSYLIGLHTTMVAAAECINREINFQMGVCRLKFRQDTKQDWKNIKKNSDAIKYWYDKWVTDAAKGCKMIAEDGDTDDPIAKDDAIRDDGNSIAKIMCLIYNATYRDNQGALKKIFDFLVDMQVDEMQITPSVINKFKLQ